MLRKGSQIIGTKTKLTRPRH